MFRTRPSRPSCSRISRASPSAEGSVIGKIRGSVNRITTSWNLARVSYHTSSGIESRPCGNLWPDAEEAVMGTTALVLGGGGALGIAWEAGLLAGLAEGGVDASAAELIVG